MNATPVFKQFSAYSKEKRIVLFELKEKYVGVEHMKVKI